MQNQNDDFDLEQRIVVLESLLKLTLPYIIYHYERSAVGFGKESKELINRINKLLGDDG